MKQLVISGINLFEGGPLSVFHDCLDHIIASRINDTYQVTCFVHKRDLFKNYSSVNNITIIELPKSRTSYVYRLWYEYVYFFAYSKGKNIDTWISLHDITPNVITKQQYVYCHNSTPFMKKDLKNIRYSINVYLFSCFYKYLYRINIKKNTGVIVQQEWIRDAFKKLYRINNIIVAKPTTNTDFYIPAIKNDANESVYTFIFASFPRFFKNFEVICNASAILAKKRIRNYKIILTINGSENSYSRNVYKKFKNDSNIKFIGLQSRETLFKLYNNSDCLIFPSKLETWGLPITEFKSTNKPILLADLPYSHETLGQYNHAYFFNPNDANELASIMEAEIQGKSKCYSVEFTNSGSNCFNSWKELICHIFPDIPQEKTL